MTVEAALIVPLFFLLCTALISSLEIYRVQTTYTEALEAVCEEGAMYAAGIPSQNGTLSTLGKAALLGKAGGALDKNSQVSGLRLSGSVINDEQILLQADYRFSLWPGVALKSSTAMTAAACIRPWVGYSGRLLNARVGAGAGNDTVYISDNREVYHLFEDCSYLAIDVRQVTAASAKASRNGDGDRYTPCELCAEGKSQRTAYITADGEHYHYSASCSGLKRSIRVISREQAGQLCLCSRCQKRLGS